LSLPKEHPRTPGRTAISVVAVTPRREFMKYPGKMAYAGNNGRIFFGQ